MLSTKNEEVNKLLLANNNRDNFKIFTKNILLRNSDQ